MAKPRVYIARRIPQAALDLITPHCTVTSFAAEETPVPRDDLLRAVAGAEGLFTLLTERVDQELLDAAPRLRVVANMAVGYDNITVPACTARRVLVTNTPGVLTETTADLAFALLLAVGRRVVESAEFLKAGRWRSWYPLLMTGQDIHGATLGIVGMGRIGQAVARRARGFAMKLLYHNRRPNPAAEAETGAQYRALDDLLMASDFVLVLTPLSPETRGLIGARELALMKPTAALVNAARGGIVDEEALADALQAGRIWAAGADVFAEEPVPPDHPLLRLPNFTALPHIGSASIATRIKMATTAAVNLVAGVTAKRPPNLVNPDAWAD